MSQSTRMQVLEKLRRRYQTAGLEHKTKLIDQAVELLGYHRKAASPAPEHRETNLRACDVDGPAREV